MKVTGIFAFKDGRKMVSGQSDWDLYEAHKLGDVVVCGDKKWRVIGVSHFRQGCFGKPTHRHHGLMLKPVGHEDMPNEGDELINDTSS